MRALKDRRIYYRKDENGKDVQMVLHAEYKELLVDLDYIKSMILNDGSIDRIKRVIDEAEAHALPGIVPNRAINA